MQTAKRLAALVAACILTFADVVAAEDAPQVVPAPPVAPDQDQEPKPYEPGDPAPAQVQDEFIDAYGDSLAGAIDTEPSRVRYVLERIEVRGNTKTRARVVRNFVPLGKGEFLDPESPDIEAIEWRLMGTGWFDQVRLHLEKGQRRGWVVLVVQVKERNTIVIEQLTVGAAEGMSGKLSEDGKLFPYLGASLAESNLLGLGIRLSGTFLVSQEQQGFRIGITDPKRFRDTYALRFAGFFNNAQEFFGNDPMVSFVCPLGGCPASNPASALVEYRRGGVMLGTGRDVGTNTRYSIDWQGEFVHVLSRPEAASERRGSEVRPIDFSILDGRSFVSVLRFALTFDKRDDPGMTSRGILIRANARAATRILGSDYDFLRVDATLRKWWRLPWKHSIRFGVFTGAVLGDAPFFYLFHISDLTDLIPSRILEMQLDRRPPPNLLNTAISVMRTEELAVRTDVTYELPLYRRTQRRRGLRALNAYFTLGAYTLADLQDPKLGIPGFEGAGRFPIDLTFDVGFRFDTRAGVLQVGFSNLLGFIKW